MCIRDRRYMSLFNRHFIRRATRENGREIASILFTPPVWRVSHTALILISITSEFRAGCEIGTVVALPVSAYLASSSHGWPSIFYVTGGIASIWVLLWIWLGASSPESCSYISEKERAGIKMELENGDEKIKVRHHTCFSQFQFCALHCFAISNRK